ncbi:protein of unknown function [Bradyrhizobium vignae]|uniref:Uncharacterized protein n=1 Tax=Bradyrhizobium vignae TaxID=1549949 RepID=A0A2U3Q285_9BRAD|nr:protein of unknown function [Bradyrhizobium vignae]
MLETDHAWSFYGFAYPNHLAALDADVSTVRCATRSENSAAS